MCHARRWQLNNVSAIKGGERVLPRRRESLLSNLEGCSRSLATFDNFHCKPPPLLACLGAMSLTGGTNTSYPHSVPAVLAPSAHSKQNKPSGRRADTPTACMDTVSVKCSYCGPVDVSHFACSIRCFHPVGRGITQPYAEVYQGLAMEQWENKRPNNTEIHQHPLDI